MPIAPRTTWSAERTISSRDLLAEVGERGEGVEDHARAVRHLSSASPDSVSGGCRRELFERGERVLLAVGQDDEARQAEQLEEFERVRAHAREGDARGAPLGLVDDAEQ